jgi:hypothetical protein
VEPKRARVVVVCQTVGRVIADEAIPTANNGCENGQDGVIRVRNLRGS